MTMHNRASEPTLQIREAGDRRRALLRHRLRSTAYRIAAECERLLDELHQSERRSWSEALGQILIAARRLIALTAPGAAKDGVDRAIDDLVRPSTRVLESHATIIAALNSVLPAVALSTDEDLVIRGLHEIRNLAVELVAEPDVVTGIIANATITAAPVRRFRVLVVDDEPLVRDLLRRQLTDMGYDVVPVENGHAALATVGNGGIDLILTDIEMPELDGLGLLSQLKENEGTRDIPVIVISSQGDLASVVKCIQLGAEDHIAKPFERLLLRARVVASLERKRARDVELDQQRRVGELTAAAVAVESDAYQPGSLHGLIDAGDGISRLARVFDRMVSGMRSREGRLQQQLTRLKTEAGETDTNLLVAADNTDESPFASGEVLASRYEITGRLGRGGMGMVYRARDLELGEDIALKVVRQDIVRQDPVVVDRLKSEIRLARKISHQNVVRAHDLGEWHGTYFITMEYVQGISVAELLDRRGRLTVESTLAIGRQLCEALAVAHAQDIVHRDIKPANLLVDAAGALKVMDFGIARSIAREAKGLTAGGFLVGTPQYMAPEVLMGRPATAGADLYAVGVVLYECLTGHAPFVAESPIELLAAILEAKVGRISRIVPDAPPRLDALVHQQLRFEPSERAISARELSNQLAEIEYTNQGEQ